ncbi:MAG: cadherin-like domain-containing protein, partial [Actinobacteria bacterium]|nr:cadherin-like domain-containing protein [Actinomycetota bacterium]
MILTALTAVALALGGAYIAPAPAQAATAPTAVDDHFEMTAGTVLTVSRPGLLSNDIAPQLDSVLWINNHTEPAQGTLDFSEVNGSFSYTPPAGFVGTTTFTYTPRDYATNLQGNWATVTIEVKPVGQAVTLLPEAVDDTYTYTPKTSLYVAAPGLLGNDALHSGNATVSLHRVISQSLNIAVNSDGSFFFTASNASVNTYSFEYKVCTAVGCSIAQAWLKPTTAGEQPSGPSAPPAGGNA